MSRDRASTGLEEARHLIESHRAWTARAFCMATAELRGTFEPDRPMGRERRRRDSRRVALVLQKQDV